MSIFKNRKFYVCLLLAFFSLLFFGCENKTPVENISFEDDEIVLLIGEIYTPPIVVSPSYATDSSYTLTSSDSSIISVSENSIRAVGEGSTTIRVQSNEDSLLEDVITVTVRSTKSVLGAPRNLTYNSDGQAFIFDTVHNATSYTIKINGQEINLGNSNSYSLDQYSEHANAYDCILTVQVMANAPTYSQAFVSSSYSEEISIFQNSAVTSAQIFNGELSFNKNQNSDNYSILINGAEYYRGSDTKINLTSVPSEYAGKDVTIGIVSLVNNEIKLQDVENVIYYDSKSYDIKVFVLDVANPVLSSTTVSWNNVNNSGSYAVYIDEEEVSSTEHNYFDLSTLENFQDLTNKDGGYLLKIEPMIPAESVNILKSEKKGEELHFNRFDTPIVNTSNNLISWQAVEDANTYVLELTYQDNTFKTSTTATSFSLSNYPAGIEYQFKIYVEGCTIGGVNYLASQEVSLTISKQTETELDIIDYVLTFDAQIGERYRIEFALSEGNNIDEVIEADKDLVQFDLSTYTFAPGEHEVKVTHLGDDSNTFDSSPSTISFVQLESIDNIQIDQGVVSVLISEINRQAILKFVITGTKGTELEFSQNEISLNTIDPSAQNYLENDRYTISLYVSGNGENTFSPSGKNESISATRSFVVLDLPTISLDDKDLSRLTLSSEIGVDQFNIFSSSQGDYVLSDEIEETFYDFTLDSGEINIKIQAIGDGTNYLNSRLSDEIKIIRLSSPTMTYNSVTDVITKTDNNPSEYIESFTFELNGEVNDYAFDGTAFTDFIVGDNVLTLKLNAVDATQNIYYLNSTECELVVNKIDSTAQITINSDNQLVISPNNQREEYEISLAITIDDEMIFEGKNGQLNYQNYTLNYTYSSEENSYYIDLLQDDYTPIILEMTKDFSIKVKFIKPASESGDDTTANSSFTVDKQISVLDKITAGRDDQYIIISKTVQTDTQMNYALLINNKYRFDLSGQTAGIVDDIDNGLIKVRIDNIYQFISAMIPEEEQSSIYDLAVISLNKDSNENKPLLSVVGDNIKITRILLHELTTTKDNSIDDNSVKISFETTDTEFEKEYVVEIYNSQTDANRIERRFSDSDAIENKITFNLDDYDLTGGIYVSYFIVTNGQYTADSDTIYVFNSNDSNVLSFTKIDSVSNILISNGLVTFDCVENAVGYEIYKQTASGYEKINNNLITSTMDTASYNLGDQSGSMKIFIKAISEVEKGSVKFTNSNLSEEVNVNKLATPVFSIAESGENKGKIVLTISQDTLTLLQDGSKNCVINIVNGSKEYDLSIEDAGVTLLGNQLYIEPSLVLSYGESSLLKEVLTISIKVNYTDTEQNLYYLNSNSITQEVYGLFAPTNTQKYTSQTDVIDVLEHISWQGSQYNIIDGSNIGYGYILRLKFGDGDNAKEYYSTDEKLKFLISSDDTNLSTYPNIIQETNLIFPYGYDSNGDGVISEDEIFTSGTYHISVKAVPISLAGYNLLASAYSSDYVVYIMATPTPMANEGEIIWQKDEHATEYIVRLYDSDFETIIDQEVVTNNGFSFSNERFNGWNGFYGVSIQAISDASDTLNSDISEVMSVLRMPSIDSLMVDDGSLVISANRFFTSAEIEFVDISTGRIEILTYSRAEDATQELTTFRTEQSIGAWKEIEETQIESLYQNLFTENKYIVTISDTDILNILNDRSYTINVRLKGNSDNNFCIINSAKEISVSELQGTKIDTNLFEVTKGVLQYTTSEAYDSVHINYNFNNQDIQNENSFWNDTIIYKLTITTPTVYEIYAVDYYRFQTAVANNILSNEEYTILDEMISNLYAYIKFAYIDEADTTKYLYLNVFYENKINLKDYNTLYYYPIKMTSADGEYRYTGVDSERDYATIDISNGGSFVIKVNILGGDSIITYSSDLQTITSHIAYLTANTNTSNTFIRYSENILTSYLGRIRLTNQSPTNESGTIIDKPLYELTITRLNTQDTKTVYLYYDDELSAREIIDDPMAIYVKVTYDELQAILFDLSECLDSDGNYIFSSGSYEISVRTIAGLGSAGLDNSSDYLLNSKNPTSSYIFNKISDTSIYAEDGVLKFNQATINSNNATTYIYDYELTIVDDTATNYIYKISRDSDGVSIDSVNHIFIYELPSSIEDESGRILNIENAEFYSIKIKALAEGNQYVLNGSYIKDNSVDREFTFIKANGISTTSGENLRIEDGVLKWKVVDLSSYSTVSIEVSFLDANEQRKTITINTAGIRQDEDGLYQYHYYTFLDDRYRLDDGTGTTYIDSGVEYSIRLYVAGTSNGDQAVLNSNYSDSIIMRRLARVSDAQLHSVDGKLNWNAIENATSYIVTLNSAGTNYQFTTGENSIDFENTTDDLGRTLPSGRYTISIRAIGTGETHSRSTTSSHTFIKLNEVEGIGIDSENPGNITWDANEDAQGYYVKFEYSTSAGELVEYEETLQGGDNNTISAPEGMTGEYTVTVQAIGIGSGYVFNSAISTYTSSKDRPNPVGAILYDAENYRYYWTTASDFGQGDRLRITYQFRPYVETSNGIVLSTVRQVVVNYNYNQVGTYFVQEGITYYYYSPTSMGTISDFSVQVEREGTLYSTTSRGPNITMNLYSIGSGTAEDPYGIDSVSELLQIGKFASANFKLLSAINFAGTDILDLIDSQGAVICSTFSGTLDGQGFAIYGFGTISLNNVDQFALFNQLTNATIKNIVFGEGAVDTIIANSFASTNANVINLSLIANNATGATIQDITLHNLKIVLQGDGRLSGNIYIGGLIGIAENTIISGSILDVEIQFDVDFSSRNSYIGGIVGNATTSTINSSSSRNTSVEFTITQAHSNRTFSHIGGLVGYFVGDADRIYGISNATTFVTYNNIFASNIGGMVGFISRATIQDSTSNGTITHSGINNDTNIGAIAGTSQSSIINGNNINLIYNIGIVNASSSIYIGAVAGRLTTIDSIDCQLTNCVVAYEFINETVLSSTGIDEIGLYGFSSTTNVIVSGNTQLQS